MIKKEKSTVALFDENTNTRTHTRHTQNTKMMKLYTRIGEDFLIFNIYKKRRKVKIFKLMIND